MTNINTLWPYSKQAALFVIPVVWVLSAIILGVTHNYLSWPDDDSAKLITFVVIALGLIPLALVLLDFAASTRAVLDFKGIKIDFSGVDLTKPEVRFESEGIPDNAGIEGEVVFDSGPMQITKALEKATHNEIVQINLKEGNAWWASRLLALSAGAVRKGSPKVLVFTAKKANVSNVFLGWAEPVAIMNSLLEKKQDFKEHYLKASRISKQVSMYGSNEYLPIAQTSPVSLAPDVMRYTYNVNYSRLGNEVFEQILMDQLALNCEQPPDKLSINRFEELFIHCCYQDVVDLEWSKELQINKLLDSQAPYVALVRNNQYEAMLKRDAGERIVLKQLLQQSQAAA